MEEPRNDFIHDFISGVKVKATPEEIEAVQPFTHRLVEDFGYSKDQIVTHPQYRVSRSPSDPAKSYPVDIAIFSDKLKKDDTLFMIVECKQTKRNDGVQQLKDYLDLCPAVIGVWYNGKEHCYLQKYVDQRGVNAYREIPLIPINGQRIQDIGKFYRRDLKPTLNLRYVFRDIRNFIAGSGEGVTRDEPIAAEIINLLFCKIYDEINTAPDEILTFRYGINENEAAVSNRIKKLFDKVKTEYKDVFENNDIIKLDDKSIAYTVGELQRYCITDAERDVIGEAFEVFIGPALKGSQGQFFTPRNIIRTAIQIIDPSPSDKILDPACGSGGFLIIALEHIWLKLKEEAKQRGLGKSWLSKKENFVAQNNFFGIEKDSFLAKITKAYMAIVGDGRGGIFCENSLLQSSSWKAKTSMRIKEGEFDVILTNPPFGSKITISDVEILENFELGHKWKRDKNGAWQKTQNVLKKQPPQLIFIERCYQLLKNGGRLGIILPDGILGGAKIGYVPQYIKSRFEIIALVDIPIEAFSPNTTTKVHLLVLRKGTKKKGSTVFMSVPKIIGHDRKGHPIFKDPEKNLLWDDLEQTRELWTKYVSGKFKDSSLGFSVLADELENALNAKRYLPDFMSVLRQLKKTSQTKIPIGKIAARLRTGANVDNLDYVEDPTIGTPYILVKNVLAEGIVFSNLKYIRKTIFEKVKSAVVQEGDIVITRCGDPGIAVVVPKDLEGSVVCGFCFILRVKKEYDPFYVAAFINSSMGISQLKRLAIGSVLEHITKEELEGVYIVFPKDEDVVKNIASAYRKALEFRMKARQEIIALEGPFKKIFGEL